MDASRTADYQTTRGIREIIKRDGNTDDLLAFMGDRNLPIDDIEAAELAEELLREPPELGYLTISKEEARDLLKLLNSQAARGFFDSVIFWDAKRPITADVLGILNLDVLSMELGVSLPGQVGKTMELPLWQGSERSMMREGRGARD